MSEDFAFGKQKRAKQMSIVAAMPECPSAKQVFDTPYVMREILRYLKVEDLRAVRLVHKGGINRFWTDAKFVHETLSALQGSLGKNYRILGRNSIRFDREGTCQSRRTEECFGDDTNELIVECYDQGRNTKSFLNWKSAVYTTAGGVLEELYRLDNRGEVRELVVRDYVLKLKDQYTLERPFIAYNVSLRPDIWAHYPWRMSDVNEDGKLVINGKVLV